MELIRGFSNLLPRHRGCVATIGNFDGVHLGHQAVLKQVATKAAERRLASQVIIFEPLPREFFAGSKAPARLTRLREKIVVMRQFPIDRLLCLHFNQALANMPAERFIECILVNGLAIRYLVVGDDFRFGKDRAGHFGVLQEAGRQYGFDVARMDSFTIEGQRASSTLIRRALQCGDMTEAARLLGRPYRISGRVVGGDRLGRQLGYPTANLRLGRQVSPVSGVFAARVYGLDSSPLNGVVNIGTRPTVGGTDNRLEVHLLDFSGDIYGRYVDVDLVHKLREESHFQSIDALINQIEADVIFARDLLCADPN